MTEHRELFISIGNPSTTTLQAYYESTSPYRFCYWEQPWPSCVSSDAPFFTSSQLPPQPLISFPPPLPPWEIPYQMGPPIFGTIRKQAQISHSWSSYLYHLRSIRDWLSKDQGPPLNTLSISNSIWNLNWKRFCPYSTIWTLSCKPRAFFRVLWATLLLKGLHVRNFPVDSTHSF